MKKTVFFNIGIFCAFLIFEALLYFDKTRAITLKVGPPWYFLTSFIVLGGIFYLVFWYRKKTSLKIWCKEEQKFGSVNLRSKKRMGWTLASLIVFIGCTQLIIHSHLSLKTTILLTTALTGLYMTGLTISGWILRKNYNLMLEKAKQDKETVDLKLKSIRSQLNPHFMFNALTSIQNLMNKNDIPGANHYLSMFAGLTRKVLNTSDQELISIADELQIQEDYLQMEQLRFGFKYTIQVSEAINKDNTEIPAMLLQPFVENAVKHGMAANPQNGMIQVTIDKQGNSLILAVADNGNGFDKSLVKSQTASFGLKLSQERIGLLNQLNKDQPVTLNIDSTPTGTRVTITLTDLLA